MRQGEKNRDNHGLELFFERNRRCALGFSGGVDSSYLLYAALRCGADVRPYYVKSAFQPRFEYENARKTAERLGVALNVIELDVLLLPSVAVNPPDRCYLCKSAMFAALKERARAEGYDRALDGTNASDERSERPGMRALEELSVRSPLRECGLTKDAIRRLLREAGLPFWDRPAYSCLATRIPTGTQITEELLRRLEGAEDALLSLGFSNFRVRVYKDAARLQLPSEEIEDAAKNKEAIRARVGAYFDEILLDLDGR